MSLKICPNEIVHAICALLDPEDVMSFRCANSIYVTIGIGYLAHEITIVPTHRSIARVELLSMHPMLRANVKQMHISCLLGLEFASEEVWRRECNLRDNKPLLSGPYGLSTFVEHSEFCHGQRILVLSGRYNRSIEVVLTRFPNLHRVSTTDDSTRQLRPKDMKTFIAAKWQLDKPVLAKGARETYAELGPTVLDTALSTIRNSVGGQQELSMSLPFLHSCFSGSKVSKWGGGLAWLTILHLRTGSTTEAEDRYYILDEDDDRDASSCTPISRFLRSIPNLEDLCLKMKDYATEWILADDITWSNLKRLELTDMYIDGYQMLRFFKRHGATLRNLVLTPLDIDTLDFGVYSDCDTQWIAFLEQARNESLTFLETFCLNGVLHDQTFSSSAKDLWQGFITAWTTNFPTIIRPSRSLRYLMCGKKTGVNGQSDDISKHPYKWESLTWKRLQDDSIEINKRLEHENEKLWVQYHRDREMQEFWARFNRDHGLSS